MEAIRRWDRTKVLVLLAVVVIAAMVFANLLDIGDNDESEGSFGAFVGLSAFGIGIGMVVMFGLLPRTSENSNVGLVLAVMSVATVVIFWSTLPFAFGIPALWIGARRNHMPTVLLAAVGIFAGFIFCIIG